MTDDNVRALPSSVTLDLDAERRPAKDVKPPFVAAIEGREITFGDPAEMDWRELLLLDSPTELIRLATSDEDRKFILQQNLPGWKFNMLMEAYYSHFDMDEKLRIARRQSQLAGV